MREPDAQRESHAPHPALRATFSPREKELGKTDDSPSRRERVAEGRVRGAALAKNVIRTLIARATHLIRR